MHHKAVVGISFLLRWTCFSGYVYRQPLWVKSPKVSPADIKMPSIRLQDMQFFWNARGGLLIMNQSLEIGGSEVKYGHKEKRHEHQI